MKNSIRSAFMACCLCGLSASALALPSFAQVLSGSANFLYDANGLTVQTFGDTTIEWNTFDIAANEHVYFDQAQTSSWAQNFVLSLTLTQISGSVSSNGNLLLRAEDMAFAQGSTISAPALTLQANTLQFNGLVSTNGITLNNATGVIRNRAPDYLSPGLTLEAPFIYEVPLLPVPEPESYAMLLAGLGLMGAVARRRKAKQA